MKCKSSPTKRVGIISTQFAINFGAILQAYALLKFLKSIGYDARLINYKPQQGGHGRTTRFDYSSLKTTIVSLLKIFNFSYRKNNRLKISKFNRFLYEQCDLDLRDAKSEVLGYKLEIEYDVLICGSDQVWNYKIFPENTFRLQVGKFSGVKCSYAASLGEEQTSHAFSSLIDSLKDFDFISLREPDYRKEIELSSGKTVSVNVDPTLLLNKQDWFDLISPYENQFSEKYGQDYVLVYEMNSPSYFDEVLKQLQEGENVIVISSRPFKKFRSLFNIKEVFDVGPIEFLYLIKNSKLILTSSFHGMAFSINFEKEFLCIPRRNRSSRHVRLAAQLGVSERIVFSSEYQVIKGSLTQSIDWKLVREKVDKLKCEASEYLCQL